MINTLSKSLLLIQIQHTDDRAQLEYKTIPATAEVWYRESQGRLESVFNLSHTELCNLALLDPAAQMHQFTYLGKMIPALKMRDLAVVCHTMNTKRATSTK